MTAPLIIHDGRDEPGQQEVVLMLHDFSFTPPEEIYAALRKPDKMAGMGGRPSMPGMSMSGMAMRAKSGADAAPDLNDVTYDAFLANDRTLADPEVIKVEPGGRVLLRVINGSSMSNFHLDLGALDGELIAVDGFRVATDDRAPLPDRRGAAAGYSARHAPWGDSPTQCSPFWRVPRDRPASCWRPAPGKFRASQIWRRNHLPPCLWIWSADCGPSRP